MKYLLSIVFTLLSYITFACSCANPGKIDDEQFDHYDFIARGTVEHVKFSKMINTITFSVSEAFKGLEKDSMVLVETAASSAACGLSVSEGEEWLIYATRNKGKLQVSLCSRSVVLSAEGMSGMPQRAEDDLKFLNKKKQSYTKPKDSKNSKDIEKFTIGDVRKIHSEVLGEERVLNVYLPDGYTPDSTYPVIYLLDGSAQEDFLHVAGLLQFSNYPWLGYMPKSILVGIENVDRKRDFTYPSRDEEYKKKYPTTGGSSTFIEFIKAELKPFIEKTYPVNGTSMLIGQSLGGLLATEVLYKKPEMFDHYFIVSPSLWYDDFSLLEQEPNFTQKGFEGELSVYVAVGQEGRVMKKVAKKLYRSVKKVDNINSRFEYLSDENHASVLHEALYVGFKGFRK